jgi:hypothetical protein
MFLTVTYKKKSEITWYYITLLMNQKWETRGDICPISSFGVSYYVWLMIDKNVINNLLQYSL